MLPGPVRLRPSTTLVLLAENVGGVRAYHTSDSEAIVVVGSWVIVPAVALSVTVSLSAVRLALIRMLAAVEVSVMLPSPFTPGGVPLPATIGFDTVSVSTVLSVVSPAVMPVIVRAVLSAYERAPVPLLTFSDATSLLALVSVMAPEVLVSERAPVLVMAPDCVIGPAAVIAIGAP